MSLKTSDLTQGDTVRLVSFGQTKVAYRRRLFAFGLMENSVVQVVRRAPLGCPIQLQLNAMDFMLRLHESADLLWERV